MIMRSARPDFGDLNDQSRPVDKEAAERLKRDAEILRRAARELALLRAKTASPPKPHSEVASAVDKGKSSDELELKERPGSSLSLSRLAGRSSSSRRIEAPWISKLPSERGNLVALILDESSPQRRREIAAELADSLIIRDAINDLDGGAHDKIYLAFSLLFLIAKTGEIQPLLQAIEDHPSIEVRIEVIKLLTLTRDPHVWPAFRELSQLSSLPFEVQSALFDALDQIPTHETKAASSQHL
jgi:hypothetical protein